MLECTPKVRHGEGKKWVTLLGKMEQADEEEGEERRLIRAPNDLAATDRISDLGERLRVPRRRVF